MSNALLQAWQKTVRRQGLERAVVQAENGGTATFAELEIRATAWCNAQGLKPAELAGSAVVFSAPNGLGWFELFIGLLQAGAVIVPLDAAEPSAAQRRIAESLRAAFWWDGKQLVPIQRSRRWRDPEVALIKLTSGTTGHPRALVFTAEQLLADARQVTRSMGIGRRDLNYGLIPLAHSYGLGNLTIPLLAQGLPLVCGTAPLPHAIFADFVRWQPTVFPGVPTLWRALVATKASVSAEAANELSSLRLGISAGAPLSTDVARDFAARFGRRLQGFYGSSETGGIAFDPTGEATLAGGVGCALRGVKLTGLRGQRLQVSSAAVITAGNRRRDGAAGSWIMPDRVAIDQRGRLTLLGRRGKTVKIAGRRVNLAEIVARLRQLPGVDDAWATVSTNGDPVLGAAVASHRPMAELRTALHADTPAWKIPKRWFVAAALPVTARGKLDTRLLQARLFASA